MKKIPLGVLVVSITSALVFGVWLVREKRARDRVVVQLREAEQALAAEQAALKTEEETAKALESKLGQMTEVLTNLTARLREAATDLNENQARLEALRQAVAQKESQQRLLAALPEPRKVSKDGATTWLFSQLLSADGRVLALNAEYSATYGRRVAFRYENGDRGAYDVDELHPGVLSKLQIDPAIAKAKQAAQDQAAVRQRAAELQGYQEKLQQFHQRQEEEARQREEQARLAEVQRQNQLNEQLRIQAAENDRIRALAAMRQADAAMMQALNPAYYINPVQEHIDLRR